MPSQSIKSDSHHRQDEGVVIFDLAHQYPSVCCPLPVAILTGLTLSPQIGSPPTLEPRAAASSGNVPERPTRTEATSVSQPRCIHAHAWKQTCGQCRGQVRRATTGLWSCATPIDRSLMARPILILSSVLLDQRRPRIPTWSPAAFSPKKLIYSTSRRRQVHLDIVFVEKSAKSPMLFEQRVLAHTCSASFSQLGQVPDSGIREGSSSEARETSLNHVPQQASHGARRCDCSSLEFIGSSGILSPAHQ